MCEKNYHHQCLKFLHCRFLNNLPDLCSDVKTNNRSVLDVLQDLSRKRINFKNDNNHSRYRSKGLGGDLPSDENVLSKPLFVQKELIKNNVTTTRDNCTQTLQVLILISCKKFFK